MKIVSTVGCSYICVLEHTYIYAMLASSEVNKKAGVYGLRLDKMPRRGGAN